MDVDLDGDLDIVAESKNKVIRSFIVINWTLGVMSLVDQLYARFSI